MKKIIGILIALFVLGVISVTAVEYCIPETMTMVQKNPANWTRVGTASGSFRGYSSCGISSFYFNARGMKEGMSYTLIYYGDETHNDVWPYATCLGTATVKNGYLWMQKQKVNYSEFFMPERGEKIWLILSSDVDCNASVMTAWNPTEYLFETKVL